MLRRASASVRLASKLRYRRCSTSAKLYYQGEAVPRSLTSTGLVGTNRDVAGSDGEFFGVDPVATTVAIANGRDRAFTMDENGFCRVDHHIEHIDYWDNSAILDTYYTQCEALVAAQTGATRVLAFDHNLRARRRKEAADMLKGDGANAVQEPLITCAHAPDSTARRPAVVARARFRRLDGAIACRPQTACTTTTRWRRRRAASSSSRAHSA
eukprot:7388415-Prymnesium_polylepis.1